MTEGTVWTIATLKEYVDSLRAADQRALAIKETADQEALRLNRENQLYKDEKANALREQIASERGLYATKEDLAAMQERYELNHKPLADYVAGQLGRREGISASVALLISVAMIVVAVVTTVVLYGSSHRGTPAPAVVTVTTQTP